jgi:hypothetical protein
LACHDEVSLSGRFSLKEKSTEPVRRLVAELFDQGFPTDPFVP